MIDLDFICIHTNVGVFVKLCPVQCSVFLHCGELGFVSWELMF